jgi:hypothetical protein
MRSISIGIPQVTSTLADGIPYATASLLGARNYVRQVGLANVEKIAYNSKLQNIAPALAGTRVGGYEPDVAIKLKDGTIHLIEYASKSQVRGRRLSELQNKLQGAATALRGQGHRVTTDFVKYDGKSGVRDTAKSCSFSSGNC